MFCNQSANKTGSGFEEEEDSNVDGLDMVIEKSKTEQALSPVVYKSKVKWSKKEEDRLCGSYGKGSKRTQMRK